MSAENLHDLFGGQWKQHPEYTGYFFSDGGLVVSCRKGGAKKIVGTRCGQRGYRAIPVGGSKKIYVHRTVCALFNGPPPPGHQCRHLDGDINNNSSANLAWGTPSENSRDTIRHGNTCTGEKNGMAKLTTEKVNALRKMREEQGTPYYKLAKLFSVSTMTAFRAATKRSFK